MTTFGKRSTTRRKIGAIPAPVITLVSVFMSPTPNFTNGASQSGTFSNAQGVITITGAPTGFTYNSAARTWSFDGTGGAGSGTFAITDTLAGAVGNPKLTNIGWTIAAAAAVAPTNSVAPAVSGTAQDGQTLSVTNGTWANSPTGFAYQWFTNTTSSTTGGTAISGATSSTLALATAQVGLFVYCRVTASNTGGSTPALSNITAAVIAAAVGASDGTPAPDMALTSAPTAYPVTAQATYYPQYHVVGDLLRVAVYPAISESGGKILPSGTASISTTITLSATAATNTINLNAAISSISAGSGYVFVRIEHGATFGDWSVPLQYGTNSVPALTSATALAAYETIPFLATITFAAPVKGVILRGQDGGTFELVDAVPGSSFGLRYTGGGSRTRPAKDYNYDNVWDLSLEVTGLNGVVASPAPALTITLNVVTVTAFDFATVTGVTLGAKGQSPTTVTVAGLPTGISAPVITNAVTEVSKNGGTTWFGSGLLSVQNGEALLARAQTPGTAARTVGSVTIADKTDTFYAEGVGYVAPTPLQWSTTDKTAGTTIDGPQTTATNSSGTAAVRSSTALPTSGKLYLEAVGQLGSSDTFAVAKATAPLTYFGSDTNAFGYLVQFGGLNVFYNNVKGNNVGYVPDDGAVRRFGLALDFDNKRMAVRINGGDWNNDPTTDLVVGTNMNSFAALTGALYLAFEADNAGQYLNLRSIAVDMVDAIPSGYSTIG